MNGFGAVSFLVGAVGENVDQLAIICLAGNRTCTEAWDRCNTLHHFAPFKGVPSARWTHFSYCHGAWICSSQPHELRLSTWPLRDMNFVVNIFFFFRVFVCDILSMNFWWIPSNTIGLMSIRQNDDKCNTNRWCRWWRLVVMGDCGWCVERRLTAAEFGVFSHKVQRIDENVARECL